MYSTKAFYLLAVVAVSTVALIDAAAVKGRTQQENFDQSAQSPRFTSPVKSPASNRPPTPSKTNVQPIQQQPIPQQQEQQQQELTDIEPTGAAAQADLASIAPNRAEPEQPEPEPYSFNYSFDSGDTATSGSSERQETQDASGKVTGFYTLKGDDGRDRRVEYTADANGFRAVIVTNEIGTAPKNSADVEWQAQSPSEAQLRAAESATEIARQRAPAQQARSKLNGSSSNSNNIRQRPIDQQRESIPSASKTSPQFTAQQSQQFNQEPFEQIRQTNELNARTRKSRHAPNFPEFMFYV